MWGVVMLKSAHTLHRAQHKVTAQLLTHIQEWVFVVYYQLHAAAAIWTFPNIRKLSIPRLFRPQLCKVDKKGRPVWSEG